MLLLLVVFAMGISDKEEIIDETKNVRTRSRKISGILPDQTMCKYAFLFVYIFILHIKCKN